MAHSPTDIQMTLQGLTLLWYHRNINAHHCICIIFIYTHHESSKMLQVCNTSLWNVVSMGIFLTYPGMIEYCLYFLGSLDQGIIEHKATSFSIHNSNVIDTILINPRWWDWLYIMIYLIQIEFLYFCCRLDNRMAWQWAETLVEIRVTLADIRGTTK